MTKCDNCGHEIMKGIISLSHYRDSTGHTTDICLVKNCHCTNPEDDGLGKDREFTKEYLIKRK